MKRAKKKNNICNQEALISRQGYNAYTYQSIKEAIQNKDLRKMLLWPAALNVLFLGSHNCFNIGMLHIRLECLEQYLLFNYLDDNSEENITPWWDQDHIPWNCSLAEVQVFKNLFCLIFLIWISFVPAALSAKVPQLCKSFWPCTRWWWIEYQLKPWIGLLNCN